MKDQDIITELDSIIAYCDVLKDKAAGLRRKLNRVDGSTSRKRVLISGQEIAKVLAGRRNFLNKKALKNKG